jgi:hypothetical protein
MTAATFHTGSAFPEARTEPRGGFWWRLYGALAEARMCAAMRELHRHRNLVPQDLLKKSGFKATLNDDSAFPFTR